MDRHCVRPAMISSERRARQRSHSSSSLSGLSALIGTRRTLPLTFRRRHRWQILSIIRRRYPGATSLTIDEEGGRLPGSV